MTQVMVLDIMKKAFFHNNDCSGGAYSYNSFSSRFVY